MDLADFGLDAADDMQFGDGLTSQDVGVHTDQQKELQEKQRKAAMKKNKKKRKHVLTSDTAKALKEIDTSWAVHELSERLNTYKFCCRALLGAKSDPNVSCHSGWTSSSTAAGTGASYTFVVKPPVMLVSSE